ncbi:RNA 3'-terminal phosphate cyclase [Massilia arenosa]|uniref:RNA 3'-terminal phosphate cyclase n=1 Tax=Zemynaea arenosa TaxID=2561931 RepID=A0A4Y9SR40_9BURK|nr:RNA 3'-terminal phosphate cyclase [Massilia arenosa]TFW29252.1 RNA 3'-terminal phosphate cyclase [Massilia arenosa]
MIELDGSLGEGGGQMLRTSLTLSAITGRPFRMKNIRARRAKPGLQRQHLMAVQALAAVCGAEVTPVDVGVGELEFRPGAIRAGDYAFDIGTAGSTTLVVQALMPALLHADGPSSVRVTGGTHNPTAPPAHYLDRAFGRVLRQMGATFEMELERFGFYPRGGGELVLNIVPCRRLQPIELLQRGPRIHAYAEAFVAGLAPTVGRRELDILCTEFHLGDTNCRQCGLPADQGPGNTVLLTFEHAYVTEIFSAIGERGVTAETVARRVAEEASRYQASEGAAGAHLAGQLLVPFALAGGGTFSMSHLSQHTLTNAEVIQQFLPVKVHFTRGAHRTVCAVET